ncbi:2-hydroxyacyl-CoA lyase 2-like [Watersipora subatra]|uniref:2-hydroxyacyl-CoA lyase 2-like n=1 Tax=Watersipora subatra TaxID=2589382 RepID=UPI00355C9DA9
MYSWCCLKSAFISTVCPLVVIGLILWLIERRFHVFYILSHKVNRTSERHGGEIVARVLKDHHVKFLFCLSGGHISPILVAVENEKIRVVDVRDEVSAVFAADAVARLSGSIGVAAVTAGPGLTNTVTAIKNAQMAESPVLLLGGAAASITKGRGALQEIDQMSLFKPLCKYTATVTSVRDIAPILRTAIRTAQSGTPGPVFVEFPIDVLYKYKLVVREVGIKEGGGFGQKLVNTYLYNYVDNIFSGAWEPRDTHPLPVDIPMPSLKEVSSAAGILCKAKSPVIVIGSQAMLPPIHADDLRESLESLGVPCFLGGMSRGLLGRDSPIQCRQKRGECLKEADTIVLLGSVCDFRLSYGRSLNRKAKIIAVNRNKDQLWRNSDMFWKPSLAVQADAATFLVELQQMIGKLEVDGAWLSKLKKKDADKEETNRKKGEEETDKHLNPLKVLQTLEDVAGENALMVADGGDFVGTAAYILRPRGPLLWLDPGAFGTLGVGGGFALGAKLCRPDSDVFIIYGDGSLGYSIAEFDTFTRHKTPVVAVVGNDAGWTQISREQVPLLGSNVACALDYSAYELVAKGYGGDGLRVDRSNQSEMKEIFEKAIAESRKGTSFLLNFLIGKTNFREGSISV